MSKSQTFPIKSPEEVEAGPPVSTRSGLLRLISFSAFFLLAAIGLDQLIGYGLRTIPTSKFGAFQRWVTGRVNAEVIINGSSRALTHYDPRIIQSATGWSAFNLGMNGTQIDVQLAVLKAYLAHNAPPKIVVQNLESFSFEVTRRGEIYDPGLYQPYLSDREIYNGLVQIDADVRKWKYIPLYGYAVENLRFTWIRGLLSLFKIYPPEDYFSGFNPRFQRWSNDFESFRENSPNGVTYRIDPKGVADLKEIATLCEKRGIRLILVYSPVFRDMQALERNRREIFEQFRSIATEAKVTFLDYSDSALCDDRENFYNSQHLNANGADAFSRDFASRLLSLSR